jgi:hypothetical protein
MIDERAKEERTKEERGRRREKTGGKQTCSKRVAFEVKSSAVLALSAENSTDISCNFFESKKKNTRDERTENNNNNKIRNFEFVCQSPWSGKTGATT